jgi:nucleoside-diphosphate-sugar epimerase
VVRYILHQTESRIVVTGGAGFIGSHLVDLLVRRGYSSVVVLDSLIRGRLENLSLDRSRVRFVQGDIRDRRTVEAVLSKAHTVYHLAAQSRVLDCDADANGSLSTNVAGTFEVLRAASALGVERVIFASSREVYGDSTWLPVPESAPIRPKNQYGASKAAGEAYCRAFRATGLQVRIVRLTNIYGPRDFDRVIPIFLCRSLKREPLVIFGGQQVLDFLSVRNAVEGLLRAAESADFDEPINIGSGQPTALTHLAERIIKHTNSTSEILIEPGRSVEVGQFVADISRAKQQLGLAQPLDSLAELDEALLIVRLTQTAIPCEHNLQNRRRSPALSSQ